MDPTLRARLLDRLKRELPAYPSRLRLAARYVVDHPADFGLDPVRETAGKAGASTYTFVRLARHLGFDGFDALRAPFREALTAAAPSGLRPAWLEEAGGGGAARIAAANALAVVDRSLSQQDPAGLARAAELIVGARTAYVTGARASYALAYFFHYVGRMALPDLQLIPRHMASPIDDLAAAGPQDALLALLVAPYSRETVAACRFAAGAGAKLILISDSEAPDPGLRAEAVLRVSAHSTHHFGAYAGAMAVAETLLALLVERAGPGARERIEGYARLREAHDAYLPSAAKR
ncbi:MAG: MurR/RpiR family transcriptional regulator [Pseudomonadota bacterium]